jgi:hypothetical protein
MVEVFVEEVRDEAGCWVYESQERCKLAFFLVNHYVLESQTHAKSDAYQSYPSLRLFI